MKKICIGICIFFCIHISYASVTTEVTRVQSGAQRGFVGDIIANIFDPVGKIMSEYILAFQNIWNSDYSVPRWDANTRVFQAGSIYDNGINVSIGTSIGLPKLYVSQTDNSFTQGLSSATDMSNPFTLHRRLNTWLGSSDRYMKFDYNKIQVASNSGAGHILINPYGGNIGMGNIFPNQKLDVEGKIRMRTPTETSDTDDIVVTKGYTETSSFVNTIMSQCQLCIGHGDSNRQLDNISCAPTNSWSHLNLMGGNVDTNDTLSAKIVCDGNIPETRDFSPLQILQNNPSLVTGSINGIGNHQATMDRMCQLVGYETGTANGSGSFHSCGDNGTHLWNPNTGMFERHNACSYNNLIRPSAENSLKCRRNY